MVTPPEELPERLRPAVSAQLARLVDELRPLPLALPALIFIGALIATLTWSVDNTTYDTWGGLAVLLVLSAASIPVLRLMTAREEDAFIRRLLVVGLGLKLVGAVARFVLAFGVYDGAADASRYHLAGVRLAPLYRRFDLTGELSGGEGTRFMEQVTGWLYVVTGPTKLGAFFVFSWFGFLGLYCFYRAFRLGVPDGDHRRYALLVFLLPSLVFWPSSLGKEAWMTLMLGIGALGAARLFVHRRSGFVILLAGIIGLAAVRPHVAALLMAAAFAAFLLRRAPAGASILSPLAKLGGVLVLGGALVFAVGAAEDFFQVDQFNAEAVNTVLSETAATTARGGSQFTSGRRTDMNPSKFPAAVAGVLFRPFPWEASNAQGVIAALEGAALLALFVVSWRRLVGALRTALKRPYVLLCCTYSLVFIYGFSSFSNFGILTRQRVQLFPFVLVLVCVPAWRRQGGWRSLIIEEHEAPVTSGTGTHGGETNRPNGPLSNSRRVRVR